MLREVGEDWLLEVETPCERQLVGGDVLNERE